MSMVRFGFVGAGAITHSAAKAISRHGEAAVRGAFDPHTGRVKELCEKFAIDTAYVSSDALFADPEVDAVYIAVPNRFHAPLAQQALEAGKHVMLDKPFALDLTEAEAVASAARASGKVFMLGMNQRYREDSQKIRTLVARGTLGEIYHAKAYWMRRSGIPKLGTWFGNRELAGGGGLLDIGVHMLDLCLFLMDNFEPACVSGATYTRFGHRGLGEGGWGRSEREHDVFDVDDFATGLIRMKNGATVTLDACWACHQESLNRNNVELFGDEGGASAYPARLYRNDPLRTDYDIIENVRAELAYPHQDRFHNFINTILGTEQPGITLEQALVVQRILDGIYESARTGREVRM